MKNTGILLLMYGLSSVGCNPPTMRPDGGLPTDASVCQLSTTNPVFDVVVLGSVPGSPDNVDPVEPRDINDFNEIAGAVFAPSQPPYRRAVIAPTPQTPADVDRTVHDPRTNPKDVPNSEALGINSSGIAVGRAFTDHDIAAMFLPASTFELTPLVPGSRAVASDINDSAISVGVSGTAAVRWRWRDVQALPHLPGQTRSTAIAVTNAPEGQELIGGISGGRAVLWKRQSSGNTWSVVDLTSALPTNVGDCQVQDISDRGHVVVRCRLSLGSPRSFALSVSTAPGPLNILSPGGRATEIGISSGWYAVDVSAVNSSGCAVGAGGHSGFVKGFLACDGNVIDLDRRLPSGWTSLRPAAINSRGAIAGVAYDESEDLRPVLLVPRCTTPGT